MSTVVVDSSAFVDTIAQPLRRGEQVLDAPLLTTDARLARAPGPRCEFLLVEAN